MDTILQSLNHFALPYYKNIYSRCTTHSYMSTAGTNTNSITESKRIKIINLHRGGKLNNLRPIAGLIAHNDLTINKLKKVKQNILKVYTSGKL